MRNRSFVSTFALLLVLGGCGGDGPTSSTAPARVLLNFLTPATVRMVSVEASGPGISPAAVINIPVGADSTARGTLELTAGANRRLVFSAFDSSGIRTHSADTTLTLVAGSNAALAVRLLPLASTLGVTVTFDGARVTIADTSTRSILPGDSARITATGSAANLALVPADSLQWGSSNPAVLRVSRGVVTAVRPGLANVTASFRNAAASVRVVVPAPSPTSGLIALLTFDGNTADSSGAGNHFTNTGGVYITDRNGRANSAISFPGNSARATLNWPSFPKDAFTVAFWMRNEDGFSYSSYAYFLWGTSLGGTSPSVLTSIDQNNVRCTSGGDGYALGWGVGGAGGNLVDSTAAGGCMARAVITTWRHVAITVSAGVARAYQNGVLWQVRTVPTWSPANTTAYLGTLHNLTAGSGAARSLDSFMVWSRALSAQEVQQAYQSTR